LLCPRRAPDDTEAARWAWRIEQHSRLAERPVRRTRRRNREQRASLARGRLWASRSSVVADPQRICRRGSRVGEWRRRRLSVRRVARGLRRRRPVGAGLELCGCRGCRSLRSIHGADLHRPWLYVLTCYFACAFVDEGFAGAFDLDDVDGFAFVEPVFDAL